MLFGESEFVRVESNLRLVARKFDQMRYDGLLTRVYETALGLYHLLVGRGYDQGQFYAFQCLG